MKYNFGADITRTFYPLLNNEPVNLPTQTPTIYVFDSEPTIEAALAGTGAVQTISTWTESSVTPYARTYSVAAIDDPDTDSSTLVREYWEAILYKLQNSEQVQCKRRYFEVGRAEAHEDKIGLAYADLINIFPSIVEYLTIDEMTKYIKLATEWLQIEVQGKGLDWGTVTNLSDLKLPIAYRALQLFAEGQAKTNSDFLELAKRYQSQYEFLNKSVKLKTDTDGNGKPDTETAAAPNFWITIT